MSRRTCIILAFALALLATVIGWSQSLVFKDTPVVPLALWFPLVILTGSRDLAAVAVSLIQFPLLAIVFALAIRKWPKSKVLGALALEYALMAGIVFAMVTLR